MITTTKVHETTLLRESHILCTFFRIVWGHHSSSFNDPHLYQGRSTPNSHYSHIIGVKLINPVVMVFIPIIGIPVIKTWEWVYSPNIGTFWRVAYTGSQWQLIGHDIWGTPTFHAGGRQGPKTASAGIFLSQKIPSEQMCFFGWWGKNRWKKNDKNVLFILDGTYLM